MGNKVTVTMQVDDEVKGAADALVGLCQDIKAKKSIAEDATDLFSKLAPILGTIAQLPEDMKANVDNRKYLAGALEQMVEVFVMPAPAVAVPQA